MTASITWSATVRPKRASHACGIRSVLPMVPTASPSPSPTPEEGLESLSVIVSEPSSTSSSSTETETVFSVSPAAKVSVPEPAV